MNDLRVASLLFAPFVAGLLAHGLSLRFGWPRSLGAPIDRGRTLRGRPLFGASKTWRGVVAVALGTAAGYAILSLTGLLPGGVAPSFGTGQFALIGALVGGAGMLAELPNSFVKRQLGIAPGGTVGGAAGALFWLLDQVDILLGAWLVLAPIVGITWARVGWSVLVVAIVHQVATAVGAAPGMRASAR